MSKLSELKVILGDYEDRRERVKNAKEKEAERKAKEKEDKLREDMYNIQVAQFKEKYRDEMSKKGMIDKKSHREEMEAKRLAEEHMRARQQETCIASGKPERFSAGMGYRPHPRCET